MKSLVIIGRKWFDKVNGNTYHSAEIIIDGVSTHKTERTYGYGDQYVYTAEEWLEKNGFLPGLKHYENGGTEPLWSYCRERGIGFTYQAFDVKKRDL